MHARGDSVGILASVLYLLTWMDKKEHQKATSLKQALGIITQDLILEKIRKKKAVAQEMKWCSSSNTHHLGSIRNSECPCKAVLVASKGFVPRVSMGMRVFAC